jgi:hypothetical protein
VNRLVEEELERQELKTMKYKSPFANIRGNFYKGSNIFIKDDFLDLVGVKEFFKNNDFDECYAYDKDGGLIASENKSNRGDLFMPGFGYIPRRGEIFKCSKENSSEKPKTVEKEQQVFKDWGCNNTGWVLQHWQQLHNDMQNGTETIGIKESQEEEKAPIFTYCNQMKNAIEALSLRSLEGHKKYEKENDWENFSRVPNGDFEYSNAQFRHALNIGKENERDHRIAEAWNAVARLEIYLRNNLDIKK